MNSTKNATTGKIVGMGLDWLTATTTKESIGCKWYEVCTKHQSELPKNYGKIENWANAWYVGHKGHQWQWGYSQANGGYLVMFTGETAHHMYRKIMQHHTRATRVDSQVTVLLPQPNVKWLTSAYQRLEQGALKRARTCARVENTKGGETLYIGSRQSEVFLRAYDKGIEQGTHDKGELIRFEVERKGQAAQNMQKTLTAIAGALQRMRFIQHDVHGTFVSRGTTPCYNPLVSDYQLETGHKTVTSLDTKITWLRTQVAPTIAKLESAGMLTEALEALGLK